MSINKSLQYILSMSSTLPFALVRLQHQGNPIRDALCFPTVSINGFNCFKHNILVFQYFQACSEFFRLGGIPFDEPCDVVYEFIYGRVEFGWKG